MQKFKFMGTLYSAGVRGVPDIQIWTVAVEIMRWGMTNIIKGVVGVVTMHEKEIELKLQKLPVDLRREVLDYVEFLPDIRLLAL